MKLRGKILSIVLGPAIAIGVISIIISGNEVKYNIKNQIKNQLKVASYAVEQAYEQEETANVGSSNKEEEINNIIDNIYNNGGLHVSIFKGEKRIASTIKDKKGNRVIGTKAPQDVIKTVINQGKDYFTNDVVVGDEHYYAYYIPIKEKGSDKITGILVTAHTQKEVNEALNKNIFMIAIGIIIIVLIAIAIANIAVVLMSKAMRRNVTALQSLSEGDLNIQQHERDLKRKDEIGEIVQATYNLKNSFMNIVTEVKQTASSLLAASEELEQVSEQTAITTEGIERAVEDVADGAMSQAESTEEASKQTIIMGENVENTSKAVQELHVNAAKMKEAGSVALNTLNELNDINEKTKIEIDTIYRQTNETNDFAQKIQEAAEIITSIAAETNLLSLNASIEAARAGDLGRGFAVVADHITKLAEESGKSAKEISNVIHTLIENSNRAVETMQEVKGTIDIQNKHLNRTKDNFMTVYDGINHSTNQIEQIANDTKELNNVRIMVVDIISNLSAISEENAASTEETSASTAELTAAVNDIGGEISALRKLSDELVSAISIFRI